MVGWTEGPDERDGLLRDLGDFFPLLFAARSMGLTRRAATQDNVNRSIDRLSECFRQQTLYRQSCAYFLYMERGCRCRCEEDTAVATAARVIVTMKYECSTGFVLKTGKLKMKVHFYCFKYRPLQLQYMKQ